MWEPTVSVQRTGCSSTWEQRLRVHARGCFRPWGATAPVQRTGCFSPWERMPRVLARRCFTKWEQTLRVHAGGASARGGRPPRRSAPGVSARGERWHRPGVRLLQPVGSEGPAQLRRCSSTWEATAAMQRTGCFSLWERMPRVLARSCFSPWRETPEARMSARRRDVSAHRRDRRHVRRRDPAPAGAQHRPARPPGRNAHARERRLQNAGVTFLASNGAPIPHSRRPARIAERHPRGLQKKPSDFKAQTTIACTNGHLCLAKVNFRLA